MLATTLTLEQSEAATGTGFDLIGPYVARDPPSRDRRPYPAFGFNAWRVIPDSGELRRKLDINRPGESGFDDERSLEFGLPAAPAPGSRSRRAPARAAN